MSEDIDGLDDSPAADPSSRLRAQFERSYPRGATIAVELDRPTDAFSITVLFGRSGCGKTTVLRCLAGLDLPDRGTIRFGGETWFDADARIAVTPRVRRVGYLTQEDTLFPHMNVSRNVGFGLRGLARVGRAAAVAGILERFGIAELARRYPHQLSGGQRQRVALARALIGRPRLLLLDEPLSGLDAPLRERIRGELRRMLIDFGIPVLLVTHDRVETIAVADHVVVMDAGRVRQSGSVADVFSRPTDIEVAEVVGVETVQLGRILETCEGLARVRVGTATLVAPAPRESCREVHACLRADEVILQRDAGGSTSVRNRLPGRVCTIARDGPLLRVAVDVGFPLTALVTRPAAEELALEPGAEIHALIKATSIHLIAR